MISKSQFILFLRVYGQVKTLDKFPKGFREMFPTPSDPLIQASFYTTDARKLYYFELIDTSGAAQTGCVLLFWEQENFVTLLSSRGGSGDIWEAVALPLDQVKHVALRSKQGRH